MAAAVGRDRAPVPPGLVVWLGEPDVEWIVARARTGRLVQCLVPDPAAGKLREQLEQAGVYGLATVATRPDRARLPYADNLVNLLVADLDALGEGGVGMDEITRVLAPTGVGHVKHRGAWRRLVKPRPAAMDDWTHYDHGPGGNPVSRDALVAPVTALRWYTGPTVSRAGSTQEAGLRLASGRIVYALKDYGFQARQRRGVQQCRHKIEQADQSLDPASSVEPRPASGGRNMHRALVTGPFILGVAGFEVADMVRGEEYYRVLQKVEAYEGIDQPSKSLIEAFDHAEVSGQVLVGRPP